MAAGAWPGRQGAGRQADRQISISLQRSRCRKRGNLGILIADMCCRCQLESPGLPAHPPNQPHQLSGGAAIRALPHTQGAQAAGGTLGNVPAESGGWAAPGGGSGGKLAHYSLLYIEV